MNFEISNILIAHSWSVIVGLVEPNSLHLRLMSLKVGHLIASLPPELIDWWPSFSSYHNSLPEVDFQCQSGFQCPD